MLSGAGQFSEIGSVGFSYNGITHKDDLKAKITYLMERFSNDDLKPLIAPKDLSGELQKHDYLLASSIQGKFKFSFLSFTPINADMEYFSVSAVTSSGTMTLFPDTRIDLKTKKSFLKEDAKIEVTYMPRGVTVEDIEVMFKIMMKPVIDFRIKALPYESKNPEL